MPQGGGSFSGLVSGLVKGFGGTMLEIENQKHDDAVREKQNRIRILEAAVDNDNLDDDSRQSALDQLGEIIDGKPGGKTSEKLKAILDPILAVGKLMGGVKTGPMPGTDEQFGGEQAVEPPTGDGGFEIPNPPRRDQVAQSRTMVSQNGIPAAPTGLKVKTQAQRRQEILDTDKARIVQEFALKDAEKARQLKNAPKEVDDKINANIAIARKYVKIKDKENPNGRPLRDDEPLPEAYTDAIIEDAMGLPQQRATSQTVKAIGRVEGKNLPSDATTVTGDPITDRSGAYLPVYRGDELLGYQREDKKMLASEVKLEQDISDAMAANPKLTREAATSLVRTQNFQKRRLDIVNAQELLEGRTLSNKMRQDIIDGKITPATARAALSTIRTEAQALARADQNGTLSPDSPYAGKSAPQIEEMLIPTYGFSKDELMKAIGGGGATPAAVPAAPRSPATQPPLGSFEGR